MRKTKIICTLGPSTDKGDVLRDLIANGMNVARFNFSHGSYEEHGGRLAKLKALREELGKPVAALLDTKGPEIRLKEFKNGVEMLEAGQTFTLTTREVEGTKEICSVTYKDLPQDVQPGGTIMLDDGLIMLHIEQVTDTDIICTVLNSGKIKTKKGVNVPGVHLSMPYLSQKDREDIIFGVQNGFDFIAASFVRTAQDVYDIRNLLNEYDSNIRIIAKIENREGVNNIDSILSAADAVMVARGDLGVEIDFTELPGIQKDIIDRSFSFGKPIVTATQMLDSMMVNPRPTRAEISDVANAIYDGTSAIMLSGETAAGAYPVEALKTMSAIAERTENEEHYRPQRHAEINADLIHRALFGLIPRAGKILAADRRIVSCPGIGHRLSLVPLLCGDAVAGLAEVVSCRVHVGDADLEAGVGVQVDVIGCQRVEEINIFGIDLEGKVQVLAVPTGAPIGNQGIADLGELLQSLRVPSCLVAEHAHELCRLDPIHLAVLALGDYAVQRRCLDGFQFTHYRLACLNGSDIGGGVLVGACLADKGGRIAHCPCGDCHRHCHCHQQDSADDKGDTLFHCSFLSFGLSAWFRGIFPSTIPYCAEYVKLFRKFYISRGRSGARGGLNPSGTCSPCPGGEDHLKRRSSSPPVPPLLGCRHRSR